MCGIVGAVAQRNITPILVEGLKRLEYRGYDSCGIALHADGRLQRSRSTSRVAELEKQIAEEGLSGFTGIAHTRWATHGAPVSFNAHPHFSPTEENARVALVHNGIIENHDELRAELTALGYVFQSQTDTEVIAHLVEHMYNGDLFETVQQAVKRLDGAYAIAVFCRDEPHRVVAARQGSPLIVGLGNGENFVASDAMALAGTTDQIIYLEEGDVVDLQLSRCWIVDVDGKPVEREVKTVHAHTGAAELGPYRHYMQKEIFEQPRAIGDTLGRRDGHHAGTVRRRRLYNLQADRPRADPRLRHQLVCGHDGQVLDRSRSPRCPSAWKWPANTATATACRIRIPWS